MKNNNPAEDGIQAAKEDAIKREFISKLCDQFKAFCLDSLDHTENFDDHLDFLRASVDTFIDLKSEDMELAVNMKNNKHTKGPWIADGNGFQKSDDVSNHERSIATVTTNRADADLIAAAPDLLSALEYLANSVDANDSKEIGIATINAYMAIAKARGES